MQIKELISEIVPHYNKYRQNSITITGTETVEILWNIGDILKKYIEETKIAPHALYRQIYGKSEGVTNVVQKSYITREFLSRCYRVRKIFHKKSEIKKILPNLRNFNYFREAMPFFDNPKYLLKNREKIELLRVLNGNQNNIKIKSYIKKLQKEKIGIKNPRDQKLKEMTEDKDFFIEFYNYIYKLLKSADYKKTRKEIYNINEDFIKILSKNTSALALDGLLMTNFEIPKKINKKWIDFSVLLKRLISNEDPKERRRFRRLIPSHRMTQLGEMLYLLTSENLYKSFRE